MRMWRTPTAALPSNPYSFIYLKGTTMGATPERDRNAASDLVKRGFPHGRRASKGLSNIPQYDEVGSAAYRRLMESKGKGKSLKKR